MCHFDEHGAKIAKQISLSFLKGQKRKPWLLLSLFCNPLTHNFRILTVPNGGAIKSALFFVEHPCKKNTFILRHPRQNEIKVTRNNRKWFICLLNVVPGLICDQKTREEKKNICCPNCPFKSKNLFYTFETSP